MDDAKRGRKRGMKRPGASPRPRATPPDAPGAPDAVQPAAGPQPSAEAPPPAEQRPAAPGAAPPTDAEAAGTTDAAAAAPQPLPPRHEPAPGDPQPGPQATPQPGPQSGPQAGPQPAAAAAAAAAPLDPIGLWSSWMSAITGGVAAWSTGTPDQPPAAAFPWRPPSWSAAPAAAPGAPGATPSGVDAAMGEIMAGGMAGLRDRLARDPTLAAVDRMWNANPLRQVVPVDWAEIARALRVVWLQSLARPDATLASALRLGTEMWRAGLAVWSEAGRRWMGMAEAAVTGGAAAGAPQPGEARAPEDKRFAAPEWQANPAFRLLKETYLLASQWLLQHSEATGLEPAERTRVTFHLRQFVDAMSPALLLGTNPVALRRALETGGASVADGMRNLQRDLREGRLTMVDADAFAPGRNLAMSPGKVVLRNRLVELIQYAPSTPDAHATPLLILPPWINKFYILDMQPKNSMVRFLVGQGFTVFVVSWKNPDAAMEEMGFEDYLELGLLETSDAVREITGSPQVNVVGYCIGGTLLAIGLAWLAQKHDERFRSATFMVSLQDFSQVGDTALFLGESSLDVVEQQMLERGYLDSREMSNMFNLLRSNDLIWANVVNNYLMGNKPPAFDLLYWNSDGTRMARAAHSWYLRTTYVENRLVQPDAVVLKGEPIDLGRIALDIYAVGAEKDHIVPWQGAWQINRLAGGPVRFVLGSSGHIAGIINPPGARGAYWTSEAAVAAGADAKAWLAGATRHDGSWWTDWAAWLAERSGPRGPVPGLGSAAHPPLMDAPGGYVLEK